MSDSRTLRQESYNARVDSIERVHGELMILRVRPLQGRLSYRAGQHTLLGMGYWEPRLEGTEAEEVDERHHDHLARRPYSFCSPLVTPDGHVHHAGRELIHEFYVSLVRSGAHPPHLTPRLFLLEPGDTLFMDHTPHGDYTLEGISPDDDVVFAATGVGEAPHNSMVTELIHHGHRGRIVSVTCARWKRDFAYLEGHRKLEEKHPGYRYLTLTTREPENLDASAPGYVGKQYLQDYFESGGFERDTGLDLDPARTHVFLCGNPDMIGAPRHTHDPERRYPLVKGMVEVLEKRGFTIHHHHQPGTLHYERYW